MTKQTTKTVKTIKQTSPFEAARNPDLIVLHKRVFKLTHYKKANPKEAVMSRTYLRLDTAIPAAMRLAVTTAEVGDHYVLTHAEHGFEVARIGLTPLSIVVVWDQKLLTFKLPPKSANV